MGIRDVFRIIGAVSSEVSKYIQTETRIKIDDDTIIVDGISITRDGDDYFVGPDGYYTLYDDSTLVCPDGSVYTGKMDENLIISIIVKRNK